MNKAFEKPCLLLLETPFAESIASDCCYTEIVNGLTTTKKPLNGGTLGDYSWFQVYPDVIRYLGGIATAPKNHYTYYYPIYEGPPEYSDAAAWISGGTRMGTKDVLMFTQNADHTLSRVVTIHDGNAHEEDPSAGYVEMSYSGCDHMSRKCPFNQISSMYMAHIGSRNPHAMGGSQWASPHMAAKYNS